MLTQLNFDLDIDKHYNATMVVACPRCGHEMRQHLRSMAPGHTMMCDCGTELAMASQDIQRAQRQSEAIKHAYHVH